MVFIKGEWIELNEQDDRFLDYFCCRKQHLYKTAHIESYNPGTGKGEKHDPPMWITCHCGATPEKREIMISTDDYNGRRIVIPEWCPLKKEG